MMKSSSSSRARGGGDAGSQSPRCSATPIRCMLVRSYRQRHFLYTHVRTTTTTPALECWPVARLMDVDGEVGGGTGSARRGRERRLRMRWRYEQLSLRMALAAVTHHSAQPRAQEEAEGETNDAPRRPKPSLPGKWPAPLEEVAEPQVKLGQHSGIGYELVLALDATVLRMVEQPVDVLLRVDELLKEKQEEEEEEVRRWHQTPMNQLTPLQRKKAFEHISKRKRKKRKEASSDVLPFLFSPRSSSSTAVACSGHHGWYGPV